MPKHSRRSPRASWVRTATSAVSAAVVAVFAALAVWGLPGHDAVPDAAPDDGAPAAAHASGSTSISTSASTSTSTSTSTSASGSGSASAPASGSASTSPTTAGSTASSGTPDARPARQRIHRAGPALERIPQPVQSTFRIASFNVLGSQHRANGAGRARTAAGMIADRGIDIAGLQEVQRDQRAAIADALPGYAVWPGDSLGSQGYRHQIIYRTDRFELVDGGSVPYVFDSQTVPLPYARLRDKATGAEFYLVDAHNSARGLESQRDAATGVEGRLLADLAESGLPVLMTIDANEHTEWFCGVAGQAGAAGLVSANGGYYADGCHLPPGPLRIDWIVGGGTGDAAVDFSGYVQDITPQRIGISDHYLIYADASVTSPPPGTDGTDGDGSGSGSGTSSGGAGR